MKVNQIVSEHKKGVRARIYNKKATTKAQGPVPLYGPEKNDAKLKPVKINEAPGDLELINQVKALQQSNPQFAAELQAKKLSLVRGIGPDSQKHNAAVMQQYKMLVQKYSGNSVQEEMPGQMVGKVQQVKPDGTVDIQKPSGDTTTVPATSLQPGDNNKLTMQTPKIQPGMQVDASKTIEEEPSGNTQMDALKKLLATAQQPWEQEQIKWRINNLQSQQDLAGEPGVSGPPVNAQGNLIPVLPPKEWMAKNPSIVKQLPNSALPPEMQRPGMLDRLKGLAGIK